MNKVSSCAVLAMAIFLLCFAQSVRAQEFTAELVEATPPAELSPEVAKALSPKAIRITGPEGMLCEIWPSRQISVQAHPAQQLGVIYPEISEGAWIGVVRFLREAEDYRRQTVHPGVYTLRYALHPVDGNHLGVAPQRDFLLLVPADSDPAPAPMPAAQLYELSRRASGTTHPSVWSLVPPEGPKNSALPAVVHHPDEELWIVSFRINAQAEDQNTKEMILSLVIAGHAPEA